jgi:exonuclease SbcC
MQKQERETADKLAALLEKTRQIAEISENKLEKEAQIKQLREDNTLYGELALAFSKKGIQAVLIEESLPEIAEEANTLLAKMTDNRMSISIESQKDNKKGGLVETLEIRIADELGTRNYEMFSGGEAFRIDLALRIAISRLLVRRAGASLPLLIIDEGFGTQDSTGLEKLIEAINSIQDDFEKIFMVTHLEELKDRFPVVINVRKTPAGSMISISE